MPFSFGDGPVNAGESVQLSCSVAKGDKPMTITWSFYGEELSSHMGVTTQMFGDTTNFLSIPSVSPSNRGNYTCVAKNSAGFDSFTSQLMVNGTNTIILLQHVPLYVKLFLAQSLGVKFFL